jgi:hypothetical protein
MPEGQIMMATRKVYPGPPRQVFGVRLTTSRGKTIYVKKPSDGHTMDNFGKRLSNGSKDNELYLATYTVHTLFGTG